MFKALLEFIYSDEIVFENDDMAVSLLVEANKYSLGRLKSICENFLSKFIDQDNVIDMLSLCDTHQAIELRRVCIDYAILYFDVITKRRDFDKLSKDTIVELLQKK